MAQRAASKGKGRAAQGEARNGRKTASAVTREGAGGSEAALRERIRALEARLAKVEGELATALARNKVLEENHEQVRNRIDWVIDSLHNLMEK